MKKSKEQEAKEAERKAMLDEIFGRDEASKSPAVVALKEELQATWKRPSALELATLAAVMRPVKRPGKHTPNVGRRALDLWNLCAETLRQDIDEEIHHTKMMEEAEKWEPPDFADWEVALHKEEFPLAFERALELIVGKKVRRLNREKIFLEFTRELFLISTRGKDEASSLLAKQKIAQVKAVGFKQDSFERAARLFAEWKKGRAHRKAQRAALKRWEKQKR